MDSTLMLFGQFVGRWEAEAQAFLPDGAVRRHYWQIRFDWALENRAIQDLWITPPRDGPNVGKSERWGPFDNQSEREIFQEGTGSDGTHLRWIFSDLARDSFRWRAELSRDGGASWFKAIQLLATRS
jgi:hypothetical protein